ncbi:MAG: hypothetical protein ACUVQG_04720 [Thermogutta sp.]
MLLLVGMLLESRLYWDGIPKYEWVKCRFRGYPRSIADFRVLAGLMGGS